jgi:hypothetical protein
MVTTSFSFSTGMSRPRTYKRYCISDKSAVAATTALLTYVSARCPPLSLALAVHLYLSLSLSTSVSRSHCLCFFL